MLRTVGWALSVFVLFVCLLIIFRIHDVGLSQEIYADVVRDLDDDRVAKLSPNFTAEFYAFWLALGASIITAFVTAKISTASSAKETRKAYLIVSANTFSKMLSQIANILAHVRRTLPSSLQEQHFPNEIDEGDAESDLSLDDNTGSPALDFSEFRTLINQALQSEAAVGKSAFWRTDLERILIRVPSETNRNLFIRRFVQNENHHSDKRARGKLGLKRIQQEDDILDSLKAIALVFDSLGKKLGFPSYTKSTEYNEQIQIIQANKQCILEYIHSSDKKFAYGEASNDSITKLGDD